MRLWELIDLSHSLFVVCMGFRSLFTDSGYYFQILTSFLYFGCNTYGLQYKQILHHKSALYHHIIVEVIYLHSIFNPNTVQFVSNVSSLFEVSTIFLNLASLYQSPVYKFLFELTFIVFRIGIGIPWIIYQLIQYHSVLYTLFGLLAIGINGYWGFKIVHAFIRTNT